MTNTHTGFETLGLSSAILRAIAELGFKAPTPIQTAAIPHVLAGRDLMGLAQTGTGKTAAFGLPLVHRLMESNVRPRPKTVRALILAPTRELVNQIAENLRSYVRHTRMHVYSVVGGQSIGHQRQTLLRGTDILVATPGRLLDHAEKHTIDLATVEYLVLDEADQMLDLGFIHTLRKLEKMIGKDRQTLLFSATMPKLIEELSQSFLDNPERVEAAVPGKAADKVRQSVHFVEAGHKFALLKSCLSERQNDISMVFARTKHGAEKLKKMLVAAGLPADSIHGNKSQNQRERTLADFRRGRVRILVATDVAARGIDIPGVTHVYNYDLPEVPESYVHRIGRTARAGADGEAVAFCSPDNYGLLKSIEKLLGNEIDTASGERQTGRGSGSGAGSTAPRNRGNRGAKPRTGGGRDNREQREPREARDSRGGRNDRSTRENRDGRDFRDSRDLRDGDFRNEDFRDSRDFRDGDFRDGRDFRDGERRERSERKPNGSQHGKGGQQRRQDDWKRDNSRADARGEGAQKARKPKHKTAKATGERPAGHDNHPGSRNAGGNNGNAPRRRNRQRRLAA